MNRRMVPTAAALVCAVHDCEIAEAHRILDLPVDELQALAVVLASQIDPEVPMRTRAVMEPGNADRSLLTRIAYQAALVGDVDVADIRGRSRTSEVARARHVVCWVAHNHGVSLSEIGRYLDRDHTTVLAAVRGVGSRPDLQALASIVLAELNPQEGVA